MYFLLSQNHTQPFVSIGRKWGLSRIKTSPIFVGEIQTSWFWAILARGTIIRGSKPFRSL